MLRDIHRDATSLPNNNLLSEAAELKTKIAKADRISSDPRAFGVESIVMRINARMLPEAIRSGNRLTSCMLKPMHLKNNQPGAKFLDSFYVSDSFISSKIYFKNSKYKKRFFADLKNCFEITLKYIC